MGLLRRARFGFGSLFSAAEDPGLTSEAAYSGQVALLEQLRAARREVDGSHAAVLEQVAQLAGQSEDLRERARAALQAKHEDLARAFLVRRPALARESARLSEQAAVLAEEERSMAVAEQRLIGQMAEFRSRWAAARASSAAASAQLLAGEALAEFPGAAGRLDATVMEADALTLQRRARAEALHEIHDAGLRGLRASVGPDGPEVELELAALRRELSATKPGHP